MDRREAMTLPASASYYMHRGTTESVMGLQDSSMINPLSNVSLHFPSNTGGSIIGSTLPLDASTTMSPHGVSVGPTSAMLQGEPVRRKRGRPRKYGRDGAISSALLPSTSNPVPTVNLSQKRRGRPPGTGRKSQLASLGGSLFNGGGTLIPHIINVAMGEDIKRKILSFLGQGKRAIVILSGIGTVSTVNCKTPAPGGTITYEGRFDMLNLSGSYILNDIDGPHVLTGGLNVTLAGPDGHLIGGIVEGVLIAAGPVQIIVGSMSPRTTKTKNKSGENLKISQDANSQRAGISVTPANVQPTQNLTSLGAWPPVCSR